jgi:16S rRNA (adenine1518-N6/adenine1519-N6)-dimethyltransferase
MYTKYSAPPLSYPGLLNWTKTLLRKHGIKPSDRLGQNFVVKPRIILDILDCMGSLSCSKVLEIGSGLGALTYYLGAICGDVLSIELDQRLSSIAYYVVKPVDGSIVNGDGMDFIQLPTFHQLVSNTPYYLSGRIIAKLASNNNIQTASLLVQKEVGERVTAEPGNPNYGRISIISQLFFDIEVKRVYPPTFFYPKPEVSGVLLCFRRKKKWVNSIHKALEEFTACLFSGRNKMASKQASKCIGMSRSDLSWLGNRRVREMTPWEIEELLMNVH